jgi:hypothetical protein
MTSVFWDKLNAFAAGMCLVALIHATSPGWATLHAFGFGLNLYFAWGRAS